MINNLIMIRSKSFIIENKESQSINKTILIKKNSNKEENIQTSRVREIQLTLERGVWLSFTPAPEYVFHAIILFIYIANSHFSNFIKKCLLAFFFLIWRYKFFNKRHVVNIAIRSNMCCTNQTSEDEAEPHVIT